MARDVEDLLNTLYNMIQDAFTIPLGNDRCIIDKDKALAILDDINTAMPGYIRDAKRIAEEEALIISRAKREAEVTRRAAEEQAKRLVSQEEILASARQKSADIHAQTESKMRELRKATNEYVDNTMKRTEDAINAALNEIRQSRVEFRAASKK